jgi:hypothetical protein
MRVGKNLGTVESFTDIADIALNGDTCYKDKVEYKLVCNYWTEASKLDEKELISAHPTLDARCFGTVTQLPQSEVKDGDTCFYAGAWYELYNGYWELQEHVKEMPFKIKPAEEAIVSTALDDGYYDMVVAEGLKRTRETGSTKSSLEELAENMQASLSKAKDKYSSIKNSATVGDVIDQQVLKHVVEAQEHLLEAINNGGTTSYYDVPEGAKTLNDLIEYKEMPFWLGELFKAAYALQERAARSENASEERELNKIIYYANRRLARLKK